MNKQLESKFVIYVDMLGFSALTMSNELQVGKIKDREGSILFRFENALGLGQKENELTKVFSEFHGTIESALRIARMNCELTSISFSDSAFFATKYFSDAIKLGADLMSHFLKHQVPVRGGLSYGTFETIRFKSDIMTTSSEHASYFLGTGVVTAVEAESAGLKGLRMFLHPTVSKMVTGTAEDHIRPYLEYLLKIDDSETENKIGISQEINYWNYNTSEEKKAWRNFQLMWDKSKITDGIHYERTAKAIQRMRLNKGYHPILNLRKASIKRK